MATKHAGRTVVIAALATMMFVASAVSAEIRKYPQDTSPYPDIIIEGNIEVGDYAKLLELIQEVKRKTAYLPLSVYLASPGGDLIEAMKMGRLLRELRLETIVPGNFPKQYDKLKQETWPLKNPKANFICASACFFIFVGGISRERTNFPALLGVHRPYLSEARLRELTGNQVLSSATQVRKLVDDYLREMNVPTKYADLMFSVQKDRVQLINVSDFRSDLQGYIPELRDWLDAKCDNLTEIEKVARSSIASKKTLGQKLTNDEENGSRLLEGKMKERAKCRSNALVKLRWEAWEKFQRR